MSLRLLLRLLFCGCLLVSDGDENHTPHLSEITTTADPGPSEKIIREDEKYNTLSWEPHAHENMKRGAPEHSEPHMLADQEQVDPLRSEPHTWKEGEEDPPNLEPIPLNEEERKALLLELHANEKMKWEGASQDREARGNEDNENGLFPLRLPMATTVPGPSVPTFWEAREREVMFASEPPVAEKLKRDDTLENEKEDNSSVSSEFADFDDSEHPADSDDSEHPADSNDLEHPERTIEQMKPAEGDEDEDEEHEITFEGDLTGDKHSHNHHGHSWRNWKDHYENHDHHRENIHVEVRIREAECYSSHTESSFIVFLVALDFSHVYLSSVLIKSEKFTFDNVTNTHSYKGYLDKQKCFHELDECFQEGNIDCVPRADAVFIRFGSEPDDPWAIDQIDVDVKFYLGLEEDDWFEWHFEHALLLPCSSWLNERNTYQIGPRVGLFLKHPYYYMPRRNQRVRTWV
ncbi:hypothetical protein V3C99_011133 [Haemonchus contortus]